MAMSLPGRLGALVLVSFAVHAALLVNSVESALWNEQGREGVMLAQQLADAAAPAALGHDMVSLSVLTGRFENRPGLEAVRIVARNGELLAQAGNAAAEDGRLFPAPLLLQGQNLGRVELRLSEPSRGEILRQSRGNIALSALLHALLLGAGLVLSGQGKAPGPASRRPEASNTSAPVAENAPQRPVALLHLALDDPNNLLLRVNASTADELLTIFDHLLDRAARLYGGEVLAPFSPKGTTVAFYQADAEERAFQALLCGQLFLLLASSADEQRRAASLFSLPVKAGAHHAPENNGDSREIVSLLALTAPRGRLLTSTEAAAPTALARCQTGQSLSLAIGAGAELAIAVIERLQPEYQQLVQNQSQQLIDVA